MDNAWPKFLLLIVLILSNTTLRTLLENRLTSME